MVSNAYKLAGAMQEGFHIFVPIVVVASFKYYEYVLRISGYLLPTLIVLSFGPDKLFSSSFALPMNTGNCDVLVAVHLT